MGQGEKSRGSWVIWDKTMISLLKRLPGTFWIVGIILLWPGLSVVAGVIWFGAQKHSDHGWVHVSDHYHLAACHRHLAKVGDDAESGLPHLAHAACRLLFILSKKG